MLNYRLNTYLHVQSARPNSPQRSCLSFLCETLPRRVPLLASGLKGLQWDKDRGDRSRPACRLNFVFWTLSCFLGFLPVPLRVRADVLCFASASIAVDACCGRGFLMSWPSVGGLVGKFSEHFAAARRRLLGVNFAISCCAQFSEAQRIRHCHYLLPTSCSERRSRSLNCSTTDHLPFILATGVIQLITAAASIHPCH